ncbi:MAG: zinc ribbon domain-containing protein [Terriglobia bacterium]
MLEDLKRLIELQQIDLRLREVTHQIDQFPAQLATLDKQLRDAQAAQQARGDRLTENLKNRKKFDLEVQGLEEKISKYKGQLYEVKSNEAYRALQQEIETAEQEKRTWEDKELEAMVAAEQLEAEVKTGEAQTKQVEAEVARARQQAEAEQQAREAEAAEFSQHQAELRAGIEAELLEQYDRIARAHGGIALAEAREEVCQVCLVRIRPQVYTEVKRNDQIILCDSCHRILYYLPLPSPTAQPVEASQPRPRRGQ